MNTTTEAPISFCPYCTVLPHVFSVPVWNLAHRTTAARGVPVGIYYGCSHFYAIQPREFVAKTDCAEVEARWRERCETLFAELTARWSDEERATLRAKHAALIAAPEFVSILNHPTTEEECPI